MKTPKTIEEILASDGLTRQLEAVRWIMEGWEIGDKRTQLEAAARFRVRQGTISKGMQKYVDSSKRPDGRLRGGRRWPAKT